MMIDELMSMDRALKATWDRYLEFLQDPELAPEQAAAFVDRLAAEPDAYLGYCTTFLHVKTMWLLRLEHHEEAADAWIARRMYGAGATGYDPNLLALLKKSPVVLEANTRYARQCPDKPYDTHQRVLVQPLTWLERRPLPIKREWDVFNHKAHRKTLLKGDDVYLFRCYSVSGDDALAASPELFDADPLMTENRRKYEHEAYDLRDYRTPHPRFHAPFINHFLATCEPETFDLKALLRKAATERGGEFTYKLATGPGWGDPVLFADERNVNCCSNSDTVYLLYILKKCGYLEEIFKALPELPEDFPLLLMCFADAGIRQRVEAYMGIPGLAAMYDLAFAPRRLNVRDQVKLVEFGRKNPRFQELLGASLFRYGYHLYNQYRATPDWYVLEFAQFRRAFCSDVMLFLVSAPDTLLQLRQFLEYGPGTCFGAESAISEGFRNCSTHFYRNILGYLALNKDSRLAAWQESKLENNRWDEEYHRLLKTRELVAALQKLS